MSPEQTPTLTRQLTNEQLEKAGLVGVTDTVRAWIEGNERAMQEVEYLGGINFGDTIRDNGQAQIALMSVFRDAKANAENANTMKVSMEDQVKGIAPEDGSLGHVPGSDSVFPDFVPDNIEALPSVPLDVAPTAPDNLSAIAPAPAATEVVATKPEVTLSPAQPAAAAGSYATRQTVARPTTAKENTLFESRTVPKEKKKKKIGHKVFGTIGAGLVAGGTFFSAFTAANAYAHDHEGPAKDDRASSATYEADKPDVAPAPTDLTLEQKRDFFANAVDVHNLPGRIGNNFGPALTDDDMRIDTPELREKNIRRMDEMIRGNVDIMVSYMYTFKMTGPAITGDNAAARLHDISALTAYYKDPANVSARYDAWHRVSDIFHNMQGGAKGQFGPNHISWYIGPNGLGLDRNVQEANATYYSYTVTLEDGTKTDVQLLMHCYDQAGTEELQQVSEQVLITQIVEQQQVQQVIEYTPAPPIIHITPPHGHGGHPTPPPWHPPKPPRPQPKQVPRTFADNQFLKPQGSGRLETVPKPVPKTRVVNGVTEQFHIPGGAPVNHPRGIQAPNAPTPHVDKPSLPKAPKVNPGTSNSDARATRH